MNLSELSEKWIMFSGIFIISSVSNGHIDFPDDITGKGKHIQSFSL